MKKLIFGLLFMTMTAQAFNDPENVVATIKNNAGGEIVFTIRKNSKCPEFAFEVYSVSSSNDLITGCWFLYDGYLVVVWANGMTKMFNAEDVKLSDWVNKMPSKPANQKPKT